MLAMDWMQWMTGVTMGLALAATCGLRAFLPLFAVGCLGATDQIELAETYDWLQSPIALVGLGLAVVLEIGGDKFPVVDHLLDSAAVFIKPIGATLAAASVMTDLDPMYSTVIGLVAGGSLAEGVHLVKAKIRLWSSALTATIANPFISLFEDLMALISTILAFVVPALICALAVVAGVIGFRWWVGRRRQKA